MFIYFLIATVLALSFALTYGLRKYALARSIIDVPNARSSHTVPTPRGGGVAIVLSFLVSIIALASLSLISLAELCAMLGSGLFVAALGFLDDHGHVAARWRLLGHFSASLWAVYWLGGLPTMTLFSFDVDLGWLGSAFAILYLVWMLNLYNFMDGIDGIASVEAICACLSACLLYWLAGFDSLTILPLVLAMAVAGFLFWNFPPARIFMGDAGSGFLGIILAMLSLQAAWASPKLLWVWLILLGVFIVDATFTLIRRLVRGDKVYEAHRSHAYQFASRQFGMHLPVTLAVAVINLLWLLPIAACVVLLGLDGAFGLILAYAPLVVLAFKFKAGALEPGDLPSVK
ncbi:MraY family glycosyltransferase [Pseudomonas tussilaginis]|uniref:MraY family glycosyltransferase n=1 Tax=Pseudomonas putida TaxID=303 RepID=UPI002363396D|nr:glycosyltransferase family 4 protein [Pseudomonas putida]MDD1976819.1 glycosyltransferase family 4 protein [Pseudomonas putida]